jgi:uncharacterized membrane protein YdfJ with MMPL/SSD domain
MFRRKHRAHRPSEAESTEAQMPGGAETGPGPPRANHLAARMGRWSAAHWKTATFGWLAFAIIAFAVSTQLTTEVIDYQTTGPGESGRANRILDAGFKPPANETVFIDSEQLTTTDPAFRAAIDDTLATLEANPVVQNVRSPLAAENAGQVSQDQRSVLVDFEIRGDRKDAVDKIDPVIAEIAEVQRANPSFYIAEFGDASANKEIEAAVADDLKKAGLLSIPVTLIILVITFGALVAAGIPLLIGLTAVFATFGLVALVSQGLPMSESVRPVVLLIGLAVGVDYSMFYLRRWREERAAGRSERAALEAAAATSGRSVLISGLTVMVAMAGMFLTGDAGFASFGLATILVVAAAMLASLTILPALLARLGDKVEWGRIPFVGRRRDGGDSRFWGAIVTRVLRRPVVSVVLAAGLLLVIAYPALQLHTAQPAPDTLPPSLPIIKTYHRLQAAFPGAAIPAVVVVEATDVNGPEVQDAIVQLKQQALASGRMHEPITVEVNEAGTVAVIAIPVDGNGNDDASEAALTTLRDDIVPTTVGALPDAETGVTGQTALSRDFNDLLKSTAPIVFGFVLVFAFALMLFAFRSIVIAAKSIILNLLSVAAAYGVLVMVFQHGWGKGLLNFEATGSVEPFLPIMLFVILFGLSMDYHVFILGRIKELYDRGESTDDAITHGITSTAGVVTSAAIVMVVVFSIFATLDFLFLKQFGVGLAAAILIDATIIRGVLLPASMKLLGDWNWYLPRWLEWMPGKSAARWGELPTPTAPATGPTGG